MQQQIDYDLLASKIAQHLKDPRLNEERIWDCDDCAEYFKVPRRQFAERISKNSGFPHPINGSIRWRAVEVIQWATTH
jgi:predicted DNA-binding transcriptional regulator AlpA